LKDVDSRVFTRMLRKDGRTDGSVTISLRNFVGEGITIVEKGDKIDTLNTRINDRSRSWLGTGTSIKSGRVKLGL